ncbi:MBL fold metallo-hydrolase [Paenibacillus sp. sgz500958]|uniref:MBL fold metallo-hydrolase n=1 Tax=Paenibacillus sp. sgz500958 TaxID=3242475 RepID=UPI0036D41BD3
MKLQLVRHATLWLEYGGVTLLIDPMLSAQGENPPIMNSNNDRRNPLLPLPGPVEEWLSPDAVLVTHLHLDHWDTAAISLLDHSLPVLCQPGDSDKIIGQGFTNVTAVADVMSFLGIHISRTGGRHGTGAIGQLMGKVSGFVLRAEGEPVLYIAGDTIWCEEVSVALEEYQPDVTVVNAGGAEFLEGGRITMDERDIAEVLEEAPGTKVVAVHMDSINHCLVTREALTIRLKDAGLSGRVMIPGDGESLVF